MAKSINNNQSLALSVSQLSVNYDKIPVLWDINLGIPAGNIVGIIGPNGAGKSTLLKAILGMVDTLSGKIEFFGHSLKNSRNKISYVPQRSSIDWDFPISALEVVMMGLFAKKGLLSWYGKKEKQLAIDALDQVGMSAFANRQISQLSGGQQQRVFIARALLQNADVYFMDEPFAGVDIATEQSIMHLIRKLRDKGKTLLIVHHDLNSVETYFDWVVMLNTALVASGPIKDVYNEKNLNDTYGKDNLLLP